MNKLRLMVAAMFAAVASMVVCGQPTLRILPLGDSITVGTGSLETGGYRGPLWAQLTSAGYAVEFVGTQTTSPTGAYAAMSKAHEGHGGVRITDPNGDWLGVLDCLPAWMAKVETPDVVLLHLGTNDSDESDFGEQGVLDTEKLLELIRAIAPKAHIVLSTLMWRENATCYANIQTFNARLAGLVTLQRKRGQKISLVDMHAQVPGGDANFADGLHPNATGYGLMADAWLASIKAIYPDPQTLVEAAVDVVPSTDAYIESHGNRSVCLDCYMTSKSRIEVDFQYPTKPGDNTILFGPYSASAKLDTSFWNHDKVYKILCGDDGFETCVTGIGFDTERHTVVIDVRNKKVRLDNKDGQAQYSANVTRNCNNDAVWPVVLFGRTDNASGGSAQYVSARIYSVKIYEDGELVHDFIPAVKGSDAGFLDMLTGAYKSSRGTGDPLTASAGAVPADAVPVRGDSTDPYVESSDNATVNLGYYMTPRSRIEVDFQYPTVPVSGNVLFGPFANEAKLSTIFWNDAGGQYFGWSYGDDGHHGITLNGNNGTTKMPYDVRRHTAIIDVYHNELRLERDGQVECSNSPTTSHANAAEWPIVLFGATSDAYGNGKQQVNARIYSVKIYESDVLKHDFRPCVKGTEVGFLDKETGAFASNVKGVLIASDNCERIPDDPYIESDGSKTINTGYCMKHTGRIEVDFQYPSMPTDGTVLFGPYNANAKLSTIFWNIGGEFNWSYGDGGHHGINTGFKYDTKRHTAVIDVLHNEIRVERDGRIQWKHTPTKDVGGVTITHNNDAVWPIVLFGATADANGNGAQQVKARIYSVKVYDNDEIEHEWVASSVNGVPMFVDKCGGQSLCYSGSQTTNPTKPFKVGGAITSDAYVESDGTQVLDTGYYATPESRIEVDFQLLDLGYDSVFYGAWASGSASNIRFCGWNFSGGGKKMQNILGGQNTSPQHVLGTLDSGRHTSILDIKNNMCYLTTGAVTNYSKAATGSNVQPGDKGEYPMGVFANMEDSRKPGMASKARVFEVRIYENEKLVHDFLPYKNGDEVGLRDVLTGALALKTSQGNVPKIGGCGFGPDHAAFFEEPVGGEVRTRGKTLSAFAPGAIGYQWYKDGEAIPGAVLSTLKLDWQRGAEQAAYSVKAIFDSFGTRIEKISRSVDVEMATPGFNIIIR